MQRPSRCADRERRVDQREPEHRHGRRRTRAPASRAGHRRRHQRAAQVVQHLPARRRAAARCRGGRNSHGSSCQSPRVQRCCARGRDLGVRRGSRRTTRRRVTSAQRAIDALEQVVAEDAVLPAHARHAAPRTHRRRTALCRCSAASEQVLVDIGDGRRVGVDAALHRQRASETACARCAAAAGVTRGCRIA